MDYTTLIERIKTNQEPLIDVSKSTIGRGDKTIVINQYTYDVNAFDTYVTGTTSRLFQTNNGLLIVINVPNINIVEPIPVQADTNFNRGYVFKPYTEYDDSKTDIHVFKKVQTTSKIVEKVVGTTFREHRDFIDFAGEVDNKDNVPVITGQALLVPEPDNQYDAGAIMVVAQMHDGKPHHLGYLSRGSELYQTIKKPTLVKLIVQGYSVAGEYNDSYTVVKEV